MKIGHGSVKKDLFILYDIDYFVMHQDFKQEKGKTSTADIALVHLKQNLPVVLENLPIMNYERIPPDTRGTYYAFGGHEGCSNYGFWSSHMKYAEIKTTNPDCMLGAINDLLLICWYHTGGTRAYPGDSGSMFFPLNLIPNPTNR